MRRLTIATGLLLGIATPLLTLFSLSPEQRLLLNGILAGCLLALGAANLLLLHLYRQPANLLLALPAPLLLLAMLGGWLDPHHSTGTLISGALLTLLMAGSQWQASQLQQLRRQHEQQRYRHALQAAEERGRAGFMADINHEIRTPLNGVLGMTELLLATPLSPRQRDYVQTIHSSGSELLQLLNTLLNVPGTSPAEQPAQSVPFDLAALVRECQETASSLFNLRKVRLQSQISPFLSHECHGDPGRLRQILSRLLEHALQRSQEGDTVLLELQVDSSAGEQKLYLSVQDSGYSLPAAERAQILAAQPATTSLRDQTDLGLCRQFTDVLRGSLALATPSGGGLCVQITLPIDCTPTLRNDPQLLSGARVLVVDASAAGRSVTTHLCNGWSMQTQEADCQSAAIAVLRAQNTIGQPVDVVLIDQDLPEGALSLAERIRSMPAADDMLLLLCGQGSSLMEARAAGINRVLPRPLSGYTLRATLEEELTRLRQTRNQQGSERPPRVPPDFSVLVVEDDAISAKVIQGLLAKLNITPELAIDGQQALDAMARRHYDLILMDCEMPVLDGFSATSRQREREQEKGLPRQPIVALSAHVLDDQRERMRQAGMDDQLAKPVELPKLYRVLEQRIARHQQAAG